MKSKIIGVIALLLALFTTIAIVWAQPGTEATPGKAASSAAPIVTGKVVETKGASGPANYIVQFQDAPLASYAGGKEGLSATAPSVTGERFLTASEATAAYLDYLSGVQAAQIAEAEAALGRPLQVSHTFQHAFNGYVAQMTSEEAHIVAASAGVRKVFRETIEQPHTDVGPAWIGATSIWDGTATGSLPGTMGEDVVVAILDTGINHAHPSFADVGDDGYDHTNPLGSGNYIAGSHCATTPSFCNDKLIGAWDMVNDAGDPNSPEDSDGHGSHTASTTAGNVVTSTIIGSTPISLTDRISGVAPHANIIAYDVCVVGCPGTATLNAVNQVVIDLMTLPNGIAALNYSISGGEDPYNDATELAFLAAADAGVYVSTSAGNSGPGPETVAHRSPWVASTGASTHNRVLSSDVVGLTGGSTTPPPDLQGQGFNTGYGPATIVYAGDFGDALCLNPFTPGTFTGEIVVCDRGTNARVAKGANVLAGGAGGMILADNGAGVVADTHVLPTSHISLADGTDLKDWLATGSGHMGSITGTNLDYAASNGDIMAGFSSRGPNTTFDVLKPDMTAPGVSIWAAYADDGSGPPDYNFISGTSMASPHNAGSGALMAALHPDWSPHEIRSAIMSTSLTDGVVKEDEITPADHFDMGSGRVDLTMAGEAGLVLDETTTNFEAADPSLGGNPAALNIASLYNSGCFGTCSWTRTVSSTLDYAVTWYSLTEVPAGMTLTVEPVTFNLPAYGTQVITVTANVASLGDTWGFGRVWLTATEPAAELEIVKDDGGVSVYPGDDITYSLTYTNTGKGDATGVVITDAVPANTTFNAAASTPGWTDAGGGVYTFAVGNLAAGDGDEVEFVVAVDEATPGGSTITNVAEITGDGLSVGTSTDTTPVLEPPVTDYLIYMPIIFRSGTTAVAPQATSGHNSIPAVSLGGGDIPDVHFPVAVYPDSCAAPDLINIVTTDDTGSEDHLICPETIEITDLTVVQHGLVEGTVFLDSLSEDPTNGDPYDNLNDGTVTFITVTVPADAVRIVAEVTESEAPDIDLYIGTGDTPSAATEECASITGSFIEYCNINDPVAGTWWVLIQNWTESASPPDDVTLVYSVVPDPDAGNWTVSGPPTVTAGDPLTATISWNEPSFDPGEYWYGDFNLGTDPGNPGNVARVNVNFDIVDVAGVPIIDTDASSYSSTLASGDVVTFTATITNVGTADLTWSIDEDNDALVSSPNVVLHDNGPLVNCAGCGAGGADESQLHSGLTVFGFGHALSTGLRVSDQFTVTDAAGWTIDQFTFYAYQTGSTTTSTIDHVNYRIWDGPPNGGGSIVYGDTTTNRLASTAWSNIYRVSVTGNTQRPIMASVTSGGFFLPQGTYWVDWQTGGTLASGPWAPPITINGQTTTGDAIQYDGVSAWTALVDGTFPQGLPFVVEGSVGGGAAPCELLEDIPWASASPDSGTNAPGESTAVTIEFDATALSDGDYSGHLCINSNDPVTPQITVPVSLTVTGGPPVIEVDPASLASTQATDTTVVETLTISNTGESDLDWSIDELDGASPYRMPLVVDSAVEANVQPVQLVPFGNNRLSANSIIVQATGQGALVHNPGTTITHSASQAITALNSVSCNAGGFHTDNSYYRAFDLPSFGITDEFAISSVDFGIEQAVGQGGDQPVTVNLYAAPSGTPFPGSYPGSFTLIGTAAVSVADQNLTVLNVPIAATAPANSVVVFELFTPSGQPDVNSFFVGSNAGGQSAPSYIAAAACGITAPIDLAAIGFPNMHLVMNITGKADAGEPSCDTPVDIPWASVDPTSGTTAAGGSTAVDVTFDSTGLATGTYTGTLCINSNDPVTPLVEVPVELEVVTGGGPVTEVFTNTTPIAIPTGPGVVTSTLLVATTNTYLQDLNLTTFISHTFSADMDITIMSPAGTIVTISTDNGAGNDNVFLGTVWDDSADPDGQVPYTTNNGLVTDHAYVNLTAASPLVPEEAFGAFIGEDPNGVWTITVSDDLAGDGGSLNSWILEITTIPTPVLSTQTDTNTTPLAIPTGPAVVSSTLTVSGAGTYLQDLNLTTFISHTFAADMDITIMSPSGTIVTISTDNGAGNDNVFAGTVWDDDADPDGQVPYTTNNGLVTDNAYVNLTLASPLDPEEAFGAFIGEDPNGVWVITISDDLSGDGGSLNSWSLEITTQ